MTEKITSLANFENLPKDTQDYYFASQRNGKTLDGWKIHLFLNKKINEKPSLASTGVGDAAKVLIKNNIEHKYGKGSDGSRTFTIYPGGDRDNVVNVAKELDTRFSGSFASLSPEGAALDNDQTDYMLSANIGMRFDGLKIKGYGWRGVPRIAPVLPNGQAQKGMAKALLQKDISNEQEKALQLLAGHIMLAKHCGSVYLGKDYKNDASDWDRFLFNDMTKSFSPEEIEKVARAFNVEYSKEILDSVKSQSGIDIDLHAKLTGKIKSEFDKKAEAIIEKF